MEPVFKTPGTFGKPGRAPRRRFDRAAVASLFAASFVAFAVAPRGDAASQILPASKGEIVAKGDFGEFRKLLAGETRSVKELLTGVAVIEPGKEIHPPHQHAEEEFLLLAEGSGTWSLAGQESPARRGDLLYVEPWVMHGLKNTSDKPLVFFVVKWSGKGMEDAAKPDATTTAKPAAKPAAGATPIVSRVLHREDVKPDAENSPIGDVRRYWNRALTRSMKDLVTGVATLNPGQEVHPAHQHADEELMWIVKGRGTWHFDGHDVPANEGDLLYTEPWKLHGLTNTSDAPLTFYIVKWNPTAVVMPERPAGK